MTTTPNSTEQIQEQVIQDTAQFVKSVLSEDTSGHDWWHIHRVVQMTERITATEGGNRFVAVMAALLHDVADEKLNVSKEAGMRKVTDWLDTQSIPPADVEHIIEIIATMSYNGGNNPPVRTLEGQIVQDADRLDAIGAISIARVFVYSGHTGRPIHDPDIPVRTSMTSEQYRNEKSTAINHFHEKLLKLKDMINTPSARIIAEERHQYMQEYVDRFYKEWNGEI
ncbi:HD domain-containing protein [Paenibacillus sp. KACC 21273]|uniref:HD domain-containing protein n=1 Tax=Paenibacillus sp. KACC 21273 TaxID=3025665 RepID=UPI002365CF20|nr:HD domain-containing protein [Paenibacillus sp. KACC 21273]WDF49760.1 HD domain-containing protein [Paenibacillus sp. KACC 21273]